MNRYFGASTTGAGSTLLLSAAHLNIQAGYTIGNSNVLQDLGDFVVQDFNYSGPKDQRVSIQAIPRAESLNDINTAWAIQDKSNIAMYDDFNDPAELGKYSTTGNMGVTSGGLLVLTDNTRAYALLTADTTSDNYRIVTKFKAQAAADADMGIIFNASDVGASIMGYYWRIRGGVNQLQLGRIDNNGQTNLFTASFTPQDNTYYYLGIHVRDGFTTFMGATTITANGSPDYFTIYGQTVLNDMQGRAEGLLFGSSTVYRVAHLEYVSRETKYTYEDHLRRIYALANVGITVKGDIDFDSGWAGNDGSSFIATPRQVTANISVSGDSWMTYFKTEPVAEDFVAECEIKGCTQSIGGILVGNTSNFYLSYQVYNNVGSFQDGLDYYNGTRVPHVNYGGNMYTTREEKWYKLRLVKTGKWLRWYINDVMSNAIYGLSFLDLSGSNVYVGLAAYRNSIGTSALTWRNFRISNLDYQTEDIEIPSNLPANTPLNRYLPEGAIINNRGSFVNIARIPLDTGETNSLITGITDSLNLDIDQNYSNLTSDVSIASSTIIDRTLIGSQNQSNADLANRIKPYKSEEREYSDITAISSLNELSQALQKIEDMDRDQITLSIKPIIGLERYDLVSVELPQMLTTSPYAITNVQTVFDARTGDYIQLVTLNRISFTNNIPT